MTRDDDKGVPLFIAFIRAATGVCLSDLRWPGELTPVSLQYRLTGVSSPGSPFEEKTRKKLIPIAAKTSSCDGACAG